MILSVLMWFASHEQDWQIQVLPNVRVQVRGSTFEFRMCAWVPLSLNTDVRIVTIAALVALEVLSPEDRIANYNQRIADYIDMGIHGVWVVNPETRQGWDCSSENWIETRVFQLADSPTYLDLSGTQ